MMSASDDPTQQTGVTITTTSTTTTTTDSSGDTRETKQIWRFLYADITFIKSIPGILEAAEIFISLLALISVSVPKSVGCSNLYGGSYAYFEFSSSSCFITAAVWYCLNLFGVLRKLSLVRWDIGELVWCGFYIFNFLVSSSVVAKNSCGQGGYSAAAVFGFIVMIVLIVHFLFVLRGVRERYLETRGSTYTTETAEGASAESEKY